MKIDKGLLLAVGLLVAWCVLAVQVATQNAPESQLLNRVAQQPNDVSAYLDLARLYHSQRRLDEAHQMLSRALALVDTERQAAVPPDRRGVDLPVRVHGGVIEPTKRKVVRPVYPDIARAAGVTGTVIVEAVINVEGKVASVRVLRSVALLDQAALDAVRQWEFAPTLLDNRPVPVIMTAAVDFPPLTTSPNVTVTSAVNTPPGERPTQTRDVQPVYPAIAVTAGVQGTVMLEATIDAQGSISDVRVLRSVALLDQAAIDAVRQWRFTPIIANGVATKAVMTVSITFSLK